MRDTQDAGEDAVRALGSEPGSVVLEKSGTNVSCVDDLGVDKDGTTRDQPSASWAPAVADGDAGYRAAIETLRKRWSARGWKVTAKPAIDPVTGEAAGVEMISTTDDHGVALSLGPGRHAGEARVVADGGCVRHAGIWNESDWYLY